MCLVHQVEGTISAGHCATVILFDISGFFDNLNVDRLIYIITNLGFPTTTCAWVCSFLTDRTVCLTFNSFISEASTISYGTPQGFPLSPILSALYISLLLKLVNHTWSLYSLNIYINDEAIVATSMTHASAA
jgi:retron-type reverse transcriptase